MTIVDVLLANALWATALAVLVAVVTRFVRTPEWRHALWLLVLVKLVSPAFVTLPVFSPDTPTALVSLSASAGVPVETELTSGEGAASAGPAPVDLPRLERGAEAAPGVAEAVATPSIDGAVDWRALLLAAWGAGAVFVVVSTGWRARRFDRMLGRIDAAPGDVSAHARRIAAQLGLRRCPDVVMVPARIAPALWGFGRSVRLLLPRALFEAMPPEARDGVLRHELAHFARRDHLVRQGVQLVAALFWWLPTAWWARRRVFDCAEECCDARVVAARPSDAAAYARALLDTISFMRPGALPFHVSGMTTSRLFRRRLSMILDTDHSPRRGRPGAWLFALAVVLLPVMPVARPPEQDAGRGSWRLPYALGLAEDESVVATVNGRRLTRADLTHHLVRRSEDVLVKELADEVMLADLERRDPSRAATLRGLARDAAQMASFRYQAMMGQLRLEYEVRRHVDEPAAGGGHVAVVVHRTSGAETPIRGRQLVDALSEELKPGQLLDGVESLIEEALVDGALAAADSFVSWSDVADWRRAMEEKYPPPFDWKTILRIKGTSVGRELHRHRQVVAWQRLTGHEVTSEAVQEFRREHEDFFRSEHRKVRHILFVTRDAATGLPFSAAEVAAAKRRAEAARARILAGEDFAAVARELSDDTMTKPKGGALPQPVKHRGGGYDPAFLAAVWQQEGVGEVSEPVRSRRGWHLIQVVEHIPPTTRDIDWNDPRYRDWIEDEYTEEHRARWIARMKEGARITRAPATRVLETR